MKMRSKKEIVEYINEAWDRVWLNRKYDLFCDVMVGEVYLNKDQVTAIMKAVDNVIEKYNIQNDEGNLNDWDYGFWSGVLATTRWVLGEESKKMLDT